MNADKKALIPAVITAQDWWHSYNGSSMDGDKRTLILSPVIKYPTIDGGTLSIELKTMSEWDYEEEEYSIYCDVYSNWFKVVCLNEPVILLHRIGGTYGPSLFSLYDREQREQEDGYICISFLNMHGVPFCRVRAEIKTYPQDSSAHFWYVKTESI